LDDGYRWILSAHKNPAAPVELLDDRHELGTPETGNIGMRVLLFRVNQPGSYEIYFDYAKFSA